MYDHHTAVPRQNLPQQVNDTVTLTATTQEDTPAMLMLTQNADSQLVGELMEQFYSMFRR